MNMAAENDELASTTLADARWKSVVARDSNADGTFYYSVKTTGVYCRPSCAARLPRRENVRFFSSRAEAKAQVSARASAANQISLVNQSGTRRKSRPSAA